MSDTGYVFAGGGTGGHLFPGLAVAAVLREREPKAEITFFTTTRPLDKELLGRTGFAQVEQPVRPLTMNPFRFPAFWWSWRASVRAARAFLKNKRPQAVVGLGGYAAGPAVVAARTLGIRTAILNQDVLPGRANRYLARHADLVVLQWPISTEHLPAGTNCQVLGCPIRQEFASVSREEGRARFGLDPERPVLLVTGASQGARTVNRVMQRVWPEFVTRHPEWQILHLSGPLDEEETRAAYADAGVEANVLAFTHEMWLALAAADAVVSRAGASTLAELTTLGLPAVLLPYPYHRDRHQHANARVLVDAGAAVLVEDRLEPELNHRPVLEALKRLADPVVREETANASRRLGRSDAAARVAEWMIG
ncbi:MAG: UDP-N-acetylglucosamine--N-acetylmuramyl-(pentapeptide) pyrophosphoryl-undecaprenol N-acetylglucosamine transferase [Planctomycetes bacterium]|nr:UDP-N-acetylglucosamine--N-acetylmuramyl-(pentapeptide) pyrophosphoryl-undecaprenol N-acetylglucosamine transferase [Planctomycetota bacterium]